jgi:hypothetical protein
MGVDLKDQTENQEYPAWKAYPVKTEPPDSKALVVMPVLMGVMDLTDSRVKWVM